MVDLAVEHADLAGAAEALLAGVGDAGIRAGWRPARFPRRRPGPRSRCAPAGDRTACRRAPGRPRSVRCAASAVGFDARTWSAVRPPVPAAGRRRTPPHRVRRGRSVRRCPAGRTRRRAGCPPSPGSAQLVEERHRRRGTGRGRPSATRAGAAAARTIGRIGVMPMPPATNRYDGARRRTGTRCAVRARGSGRRPQTLVHLERPPPPSRDPAHRDPVAWPVGRVAAQRVLPLPARRQEHVEMRARASTAAARVPSGRAASTLTTSVGHRRAIRVDDQVEVEPAAAHRIRARQQRRRRPATNTCLYTSIAAPSSRRPATA